MRQEENDEIVKKISNKIGKSVSFSYPEIPGPKRGILIDRFIMHTPGSTGVPYWDVVDRIKFAEESENWIRIGYYRKPGNRLIWGSQTTITEPETVWKQLLVQAAREMPWFMSFLNDVMKELHNET